MPIARRHRWGEDATEPRDESTGRSSPPDPRRAADLREPERSGPSDEELLRRHIDGDPDAFGLLFQRHRDRLWAVAIRTLGDPEDAADAVQDAMISAFRRAASFRGDSAVTTWLHRIVVNACLDRMRRRQARPVTGGQDEAALDALASGHSLSDPAGGTDLALDVKAALRQLVPDQQAALVLVDMLGYSVADAAKVLGVSEGTVKSRCARGRARLLPRLAHLRPGQIPGQPGSVPGQPHSVLGQSDPVPRQSGRNQAPGGRVQPAREGGDDAP